MENFKNRELKELYQYPSIVEDITVRRLTWAGHAWRKEGSLQRTVQENAPHGKRPLGRPRSRWKNGVIEDVERRGLEGNIIRKRKLETIMLDDKVSKSEYYEEKEKKR